jgi:peptide chain release factor 2
MRERTRLDRGVNGYLKIEREVDDTLALAELADAEGDNAMLDEAQKTLVALREEVKARELDSLLSGEADGNDCYLEVHAGSGGTEAQDWAEMLLRMYIRWGEQHDYKVEWLEESEGEGAGIKSATIRVSGEDA